MVTIAVFMGVLAIITGRAVDHPLRDPDGFLGPAWVRLPMLLFGAFVADILPRTLWRSRGRIGQFRSEARLLIREHWSRDRITLVVLGLVCFYVTYVSYRNLKNFLPFVRAGKTRQGDYELHKFDQWLMFGHDPALLLHDLLGTSISAHALSWIYLIFLPMVPISVTIWLVWSRNVSFGYWYVTAQCICWTLGTASYYMIPTLGPNFASPWLYEDLDTTGVTALQNALYWGRQSVLNDPLANGVQSVAGFASLHVGVTLLMALVAQYTVRHRVIKIVLWTYMGLVVLSTSYFGWHYIADDIAGAVIAFISFYLGGIATGQKFDEHGRHSHPTTTTSDVPVETESPVPG
ncbi:MAG: inositol phosphorylceramide synthase [Marmoricola sp.]|nr:inositol phosphorylceramide synthase [Marmoricola sp.]